MTSPKPAPGRQQQLQRQLRVADAYLPPGTEEQARRHHQQPGHGQYAPAHPRQKPPAGHRRQRYHAGHPQQPHRAGERLLAHHRVGGQRHGDHGDNQGHADQGLSQVRHDEGPGAQEDVGQKRLPDAPLHHHQRTAHPQPRRGQDEGNRRLEGEKLAAGKGQRQQQQRRNEQCAAQVVHPGRPPFFSPSARGN